MSNGDMNFTEFIDDMQRRMSVHLNAQERGVVNAMLNFVRGIHADFQAGVYHDANGSTEQPLSRNECSDLIAVVAAFMKGRRGKMHAPLEIPFSSHARRDLLAAVGIIPLLETEHKHIAYIAPDDAAASRAEATFRRTNAQVNVITTWRAVSPGQLRGFGVVADTATDAGQSKAVSGRKGELKRVRDIDLIFMT